MKLKFLQYLLAMALFTLSSSFAFAAQFATITKNEAAIHEKPEESSGVLETKKTGEKVRVSSKSKEGWFKILSSTGVYGWIYQDKLSFESSSELIQAAGLQEQVSQHERRVEVKRPWLFAKFAGSFALIASPDVSNALEFDRKLPYYGYGGFAEIDASITPNVKIAARLMGLVSGRTLTNKGYDYDISMTSFPLFLGIEDDYWQSSHWTLSLGVYLGWNFFNQMTVTATSAESPNTFTLWNGGIPFATLGTVNVKYHWSQTTLMFFELAGFYGYSKIMRIPVDGFNGSAPFSENGSHKMLRITQYGPVFSLGLQFTL